MSDLAKDLASIAEFESHVDQVEQKMGSDVLKLTVEWSRNGKPLDGEVMLFAVEKGGRVTCMFCGEAMKIAVFKTHYYGCRDEAGEW